MIKSENELLGLLIKIQNENGKVDNSELPKIANTDNVTLDFLLKKLEQKRYVVYAYDITDVTDLGKANYIPKWKQALLWITKLLALTIKELIVFALGIAATIITEIILGKITIP